MKDYFLVRTFEFVWKKILFRHHEGYSVLTKWKLSFQFITVGYMCKWSEYSASCVT